MKNLTQIIATTALLSTSLFVTPALGAIPSGSLGIEVTDSRNLVWDVSGVSLLQDVIFGISEEEDVDIGYASAFIQNGAGKFIGGGPTVMSVASPIYEGPVQANYRVKGGITSSQGFSRVTYSSSASGPVMAEGKSSVIKAAFSLKMELDAVSETASGDYTASGAATGFGAVKESGPLEIPWAALMQELGDGSWSLDLQLANDGVKKISGEATVTLSTGATYEFAVKGNYKANTDASVLVLVPTEANKGSALKVNLLGSAITSIQGKISGQLIKVTL